MSEQRLIDANEIYSRINKHLNSIYDTKTDRSWTYGEGVRYAMERIDNAPTIDAIPVAWIKQQPIYQTIAVRALIERWHKEQEAR